MGKNGCGWHVANGGILQFNKVTGLAEKQVMFLHNEDTVRNITSLLRYNDSILLGRNRPWSLLL